MMQIDVGKKKTMAEVYAEQEYVNLNMEPLYEHTLKIFGDIFESLIGAIFLDCQSISFTE
jgi:dsRNA-specific ribonuclease